MIQKNVQDPLAEMILEGEIGDGRTVDVAAEGGLLTIDDKPVGKTTEKAPALLN